MSRVAVVLAAGESTRLGQPKQLLKLQGETLIRHAVGAAKQAGAESTFVVVGAFADQIERELRGVTQITILRNFEWLQGMGTSVACAAAGAIESEADCTALLLLVCDQPFVPHEHLRTLFDRVESLSRIAATAFPDGTLGIPACFPVRYLPMLAELSGARGAKSLIRNEDAVAVTCLQADIDVDVPDDLKRLAE
ncbi:MAG: nucleotidyltransferase family protein [Planctomycetota bacterium]